MTFMDGLSAFLGALVGFVAGYAITFWLFCQFEDCIALVLDRLTDWLCDLEDSIRFRNSFRDDTTPKE